MIAQLFAAAGVLALLTLVPGPDMAVVTRRSLTSGPADGYRTAGGIVAGLLVWGVLAVVGLAAVLAASAVAYTVVKVLGVLYLLYLGIQALWNSRRSAPAAPVSEEAPSLRSGGGSAWRTGLTSNLLNPKIAVFYTGLLPSLAPSDLSVPLGLAILVALHLVMTMAWLSGYVYLVSRARSVFERPRVRRAMDRVTGVVLIAFGVRLATEGA
ncbi:LysE family translocator [Streptomyces daliensis]|uniref:LysE family translocator n=1 Tax=Streptomyces daliensis TaxID=299421 RepID=A0A8T4J3J9_9ACTN|nr:LysE family translocator [Streptomyces daliensis]